MAALLLTRIKTFLQCVSRCLDVAFVFVFIFAALSGRMDEKRQIIEPNISLATQSKSKTTNKKNTITKCILRSHEHRQIFLKFLCGVKMPHSTRIQKDKRAHEYRAIALSIIFNLDVRF